MKEIPAYFDTSVILKGYLNEVHAVPSRILLGRYFVVTSAITPVETTSAFRRRLGGKELSAEEYAQSVSWVRADRLRWILIPVKAETLSIAESLCDRHGLRALDAIHLASAAAYQGDANRPVPFITADARQAHAARNEGLDVVEVA